MQLSTRKVLDRAFSLIGILAIGAMALALIVILAPIFKRGLGAYVFRATIEHRRLLLEHYNRGNRAGVESELAQVRLARQPVYDAAAKCRQEIAAMRGRQKRTLTKELRDFDAKLARLLGPAPGQPTPVLMRLQYGCSRWDQAQEALHDILKMEKWEYPVAADGTPLEGYKVFAPRREVFAGTSLEPVFEYLETHAKEMLRPRATFYWGFLTDESKDAHFFGGIWPEVLGTFYLTLGAMMFAIPIGVVSAVYLVEYGRQGRLISLIRTCISTLAGVPSIVFGLFGLAFFINTLRLSDSKSVLVGSLTLSLLILPTVIRASEEALRAVPRTYKEAALSLGAGKWRTILTVLLPAAMPGIITGIIISMGRAAGETAPIIFTAAVSVGQPLKLLEVFSEPTPALSWNIYNLCTEHEAVDRIRHVQYGMVLTLVLLVLVLNAAAILLRARIAKKLKG